MSATQPVNWFDLAWVDPGAVEQALRETRIAIQAARLATLRHPIAVAQLQARLTSANRLLSELIGDGELDPAQPEPIAAQ